MWPASCRVATRLAPLRCKWEQKQIRTISQGSTQGSRLLTVSNRASLVQQAMTKCPSTHVVVSGYSQGAMLVHNAAKSLSSDVTGKIAAAVTFGDPCTFSSPCFLQLAPGCGTND